MLWDVVYPDRAPDGALADGDAVRRRRRRRCGCCTRPGHSPGRRQPLRRRDGHVFAGDTLFQRRPGRDRSVVLRLPDDHRVDPHAAAHAAARDGRPHRPRRHHHDRRRGPAPRRVDRPWPLTGTPSSAHGDRHRRVLGDRAGDRRSRSARSAGASRSAPAGSRSSTETAGRITAAGGTPFARLARCVRPRRQSTTSSPPPRPRVGPVDVLVNNAGIAWPGALHEIDDDVHRRVVETNLLGPIYMTRRVVRSLLARDAPGDLVFVASDVTVQPAPEDARVRREQGRARAPRAHLGLELEGTGIRSGVVRVGPTLTEFGDGWDTAGVRHACSPSGSASACSGTGARMDVATVARAVVIDRDPRARAARSRSSSCSRRRAPA